MSLATAQDLFDDLRRTQLLRNGELEPLQAELGHLRTAPQLATELVGRGVLTQFQAGQILDGFGHDLVLGPYRLLEPIGEGGMGYVFKAYHHRLNRVVALKMIRDELLTNQPDAMRRFQREAQAVAALMHPNVVVLYDADEINGIHFLAMEYIDGTDLARKVQQEGPLPVPLACDYIRQAAQGLQHAHEAGLVHRDIKPSNLLLTRPGLNRPAMRKAGPGTPTPTPAGTRPVGGGAGLIKILDMGLARMTAGDDNRVSTLTQAGSVIGTPDFIAPEQAVDASKADIRSDLYSLGCTFYFLLTGRPPFPEGSPAEKLAKHQLEAPKPLESIRRGVPYEVLAVVQRLMEKHPRSRYQTPQELVEALSQVQALLASGPPSGKQPEIVVAKSIANDPLAKTQAFGLDTLAIPARKTAAIQGHGATTYVAALAFSADGRLLASGGLDGVVKLWNVAGSRPEEVNSLQGRLGEVAALAFSPTQDFLLSGSASVMDGHLWRWDYRVKDVAKNRLMLPDEPFRVDALAFSRDGKRVAACAETLVTFWDVGKSSITRDRKIQAHKAAVKALAFSPDSKRVALVCDDGSVHVWEFGWFGPKRKCVYADYRSPATCLAFSPSGPEVATAGSDREVRIWDTSKATGDPVAVLRGHVSAVRVVQFGPRGDLVLSVGDGGQAILWDLATQKPVREWQFDKGRTMSLAVSPDLRYLATGMTDGTVHLYDLELMLVDQMPKTRATI